MRSFRDRSGIRPSFRFPGVVGLVLLASLVRFGTLGAKSFWGDELSTVDLVHRSLGHMLTGIGNLESTPPLYYVVSWLWVQIVPGTEVGIRALPALFGVALVPVTYWIGRELADKRAATISAALVACNPFLVWYSQEARSYSLLALLSAIALLLAIRAIKRPSRRLYAGWALTSALALATHYFAVFLLVPEAVMLLWLAPRRRVAAAAVGFVGATGALLLPLALHQQSMDHAAWISGAPILGRLAITPLDFLVGFDLTSAALPIAAIVVAAALVGLARLAASRLSRAPGPRAVAVMLVATFFLPLGLALLGLDYLDPRNLIVALVPLLVLIGVGFATPSRPWIGGAAAVGLCLASLVVVLLTAWEPKYHSEDWRAAASDLGPPTVDRVVIATPGSFARKPLQYYLPGSQALPSSGEPVQQIDVLALPRQGSSTPTATLHLSMPRFRLVSRDFDGRFLVWRYRPTGPDRLSLGQLEPLVNRSRADVIWQGSYRQRLAAQAPLRQG
jgi:mannosyltransferase